MKNICCKFSIRSSLIIVTQTFSCMIFRAPKKDVWWVYGIWSEHEQIFFRPEFGSDLYQAFHL